MPSRSWSLRSPLSSPGRLPRNDAWTITGVRVLLDGCVPRRLRSELPEHEVRTVSEMGWADLDDGPLLDAMSGRFDALVTVDKNMPRQQRLGNRPFEVVVLRAKSNRLADLLPIVPALRAALDQLHAGQARELAV